MQETLDVSLDEWIGSEPDGATVSPTERIPPRRRPTGHDTIDNRVEKLWHAQRRYAQGQMQDL
jgi:hypothetical protein